MRERQNVTRAIRHVGIDLQIRPVGRIGGLPLHLVAFKLAAIADEGCLGGQRQHLCLLAGPVVVHALGVLGVAHKAGYIDAAFDFPFVADHTNDRYPFARPFALFQHVKTVGLHPHDFAAIRPALTCRLAKHGAVVLVLRCASKASRAIRVQVQLAGVVNNIKIFCNPDGVFSQPLRHAFVANALRHDRRDRRCVWKHLFIFGL